MSNASRTFTITSPEKIGERTLLCAKAIGLVSTERFRERVQALCEYAQLTGTDTFIIDFSEASVGFNLKEFEQMLEQFGCGLYKPCLIAIIRHEQIAITAALVIKGLKRHGHVCELYTEQETALKALNARSRELTENMAGQN